MKMKNQMSSNRPSSSYDSAVSITIFKLSHGFTTRLPISGFFRKYQFKIKCYLVERKKKRLKLVGNASSSLSLDGTLSNILAMKLNAVSFFPVITSSLASQSHQQKSGILLQEGPQI